MKKLKYSIQNIACVQQFVYETADRSCSYTMGQQEFFEGGV